MTADPNITPRSPATQPPGRTVLYDTHVTAGARIVPFAGYEMPLQYPAGILKEHLWTREKAGLFDVSHMGQAFLIADDGKFETAADALEAFVPADILALKPNQQRYSQFTTPDGGIFDDLMITRLGAKGHEHWLYLVVNAACKTDDFARLSASLPSSVRLMIPPDISLFALQGPRAASVLRQMSAGISDLTFMTATDLSIDGMDCHVSRTGYTGEDGFEIAVFDKNAVRLWELLCANPDVAPIGLGARDSLRLEAGLCLYGHDIDETTSPVEANLTWSIQKRRRECGRFPGAARILDELKAGPRRLRVGIRPQGRQPAREGTQIVAGGRSVGAITSGGFGPSVNGPVAMGYVEAPFAAPGTPLTLIVRGKELPAVVASLPFAPHRYFRKIS